jgi:hypothetical protein
MKIKHLLILVTLGLGLTLALLWLANSPCATPSISRAAGPWYVASGGDDGNDCLSAGTACATINGAIAMVSSGDTIYVAIGTYTGTGDEVVLLDKNATLSGGWDASFTTQHGSSAIDGEGSRRGITVNTGVTAIVEHFTIQNGSADDGGGIFNNGSTVTINNSIVSGNTNHGIRTDGGTVILNDSTISANMGGGIYTYNYYVVGTVILNNSTVNANIGSGISTFEHSTVILNDSDVSGNTDRGISHGNITLILNNSNVSGNMHGGIACRYYGTLALNNSTVSGNIAQYGGGIYNEGSTVNLNNSTVSGNTAERGGGICSYGTVNLNNSTVSGNTADKGGGISNGGGTLTLNSSTISGNAANAEGGGILTGGTPAISQNSILAGNTAGSAPDCSGTIGSSGYNLIGNTSGCTFTPGTGDLTDISANLGHLIGHPDVPRYYPLQSGSPAIDAGNPVGCTDHLGNPLDTDQRGAPRVGRCDIGAYEYTTPGPTTGIYAYGGTPQHALPFGVFETPLQALVLDGIGSPVYSATVTFSAPASGASGTFADSGTLVMPVMTDESGIATAPSFTVNGLTGDYTVTATVGGVVIPANFLLGNILWYVAPGGDDGSNCQGPATPCATINGALGRGGFLAGDTVLVATGAYIGTGDEVVLLDKGARLLGGWNNTFTTQSGTSTVDGEGARRGITVNSGVTISTTVIIDRFTVQNGLDAHPVDPGGSGIANDGGILTLSNSMVSGNGSYETGSSGGGIYNTGILTLNNSIVSDNATNCLGSGVFNRGDFHLEEKHHQWKCSWRVVLCGCRCIQFECYDSKQHDS